MKPERRWAALEYRGEGRVVTGTAMRYGDVARLPFGAERFEPGAFGEIRAADVILNVQHDRGRPVARTGGGLNLDDDLARLAIHAELPETREADDALANVKAKILRGFSIEFKAVRERMAGNVRIIERARLTGIALVDRPAYMESAVSARHVAPLRRYWL